MAGAGAGAVTGGDGTVSDILKGAEICPSCCTTAITAKTSPPNSSARVMAGRGSRIGAETVLIRKAAAELTSECLPDNIVPLSMMALQIVGIASAGGEMDAGA